MQLFNFAVSRLHYLSETALKHTCKNVKIFQAALTDAVIFKIRIVESILAGYWLLNVNNY